MFRYRFYKDITIVGKFLYYSSFVKTFKKTLLTFYGVSILLLFLLRLLCFACSLSSLSSGKCVHIFMCMHICTCVCVRVCVIVFTTAIENKECYISLALFINAPSV